VSQGLTLDTAGLLAWADANRRDLPWRRTRDPWAVLVSELMLQQTQVARVVPRYHAFLQRFPTPSACATASVADVIRLWAGLGYNRRAVNLHRAAVVVASEHDGALPADLDALLALPGVGPYTARAVLAFAFERDVAVVDTNVARVCARRSGRRLTPAEVQRVADGAVPTGEGWRWNQAMLDLGATVCTSRRADCESCPARAGCAWHAVACAPPDPAKGSAGVSGGQSRFDGSDRQGRGRLVDALRADGRVSPEQLAATAGWPGDTDRAVRVAASLVVDGLAGWDDDGALVFA
jgi:A/G-specific adenine glycosylase